MSGFSLYATIFHRYRNRPADLQNGSNPNGGIPSVPSTHPPKLWTYKIIFSAKFC